MVTKILYCVVLLNGIARKGYRIFFKHFAFEKRMDFASEKYEDFHELFVRQLVIQSGLISLGQKMRFVLKTKC